MAKAYILVGNSGSGKGTQAALLKKIHTDALYVETGPKFRELIKQENFTANHTREVMEQGKLPPSFLGVQMWSRMLIESYNGEDIIIDGAPRTLDETPLLLGAAAFYGWEVHVIYISVQDEWARDRMMGRGREDDQREHHVWGRIQWFYESVLPAIEFLRTSPLVTFHTVNGEQTPEQVHNDICQTLALV